MKRTETMQTAHLVALITFAVLLAIGQVLFKFSAQANTEGAVPNFLVGLAMTPIFYVALAAYGIATVLWIWILRELPLSRAYPFTILSFVLTPLLSAYFFNDHLNPRYFAGSLTLILGLVIING